MKNWKNIVLNGEQPLIEGLENLNKYHQFCVVVDDNQKLLGTLSDGDVRRALLKGIDLQNSPVSSAMNPTPTTYQDNYSDSEILRMVAEKSHHIEFIPVIDENKILKKILSTKDVDLQNYEFPVVIMAGGLGSRLGELTKDCPKPLLKINGKPILELIIEKYFNSSFSNFYISVNYKSEMIEEYFQKGESHNVNIKYIKETKKLGTAGCLSLVDFDSEHVVISNGDVITDLNFHSLIDFHLRSGASATMCVRENAIDIPYGVVEEVNGEIHSIQEKPTKIFYVNAGIYVLKKEVLSLIPKNEYFDMTSLFEIVAKDSEMSAKVFPIHEYWSDIGLIEDFYRTQEDLSTK